MSGLTIRLSLLSSTHLLLQQARYSKALQQRILSLPDRHWTGDGWQVPLDDYRLVRSTFAGVAQIEEDLNVQQLQLLGQNVVALPVRPAADLFDGPPTPPSGGGGAVISPLDYKHKTNPYKHQETGLGLAAELERAALLMEMGTGKTKVAIDAFSYWMQQAIIDRAVILCPKAVILNWEREIGAHSPLPEEKRRVVALTGTTDQKRRVFNTYAEGSQFLVTNYQTLLTMLDEVLWWMGLGTSGAAADESILIKSHTAKQSKAAWKVGDAAQCKLILNGSPITKDPLDMFGQMRFLGKDILKHHNFTSFRAEYAVMGGFQGRQVVDFKNMDRLKSLIDPWAYRVLKKDCLDLPEKVYEVIELDMSPKQREAYANMKKEMMVQFAGMANPLTAPLAVTRLLRLSQITAGWLPIFGEDGKTVVGHHHFEEASKLDAAMELVEQSQQSDQKVIIWCRFIHDIELIGARLREAGIGFVDYHGGVDSKQRQARVDAFQTDPQTRVFVGQIQTGGIAITLTAANVVIYYSNSYSLADRLQSEDRAHRIGQRNPVTYYDLICKGTVDKAVLKAIREKKNLADLITGDNMKEML